MDSNTIIESTKDVQNLNPRWGGFLFLIFIFSLGIYGIQSFGDYDEIKKNWPKYRCLPHIMPFASLYGANTSDNFQFCMKNMFSGFGGEMLAPFYDILGFFTKTLMGLLNSINSMRVMLATLVGGITTIFSEFTERLSMFFFHIKMTANRMRLLMNRVVGIMFSVMYMGMSGITSAVNFGDTVMYGFLDTFCFDPDTLVMSDKYAKEIPISEINIGDSIKGNKITGKFYFLADGQPMRIFDNNGKNIIVSTNHYIQNKSGSWIEVADHPDAMPYHLWKGGINRPLICLNTNTHKIPIGNYIFSDYDETEEGDKEAMGLAESIINGSQSDVDSFSKEYSPGFLPNTLIKMKGGCLKEINAIKLGDELINNGRVIGIVQKEINDYILNSGDIVTPSTLVWDKIQSKWIRLDSKDKCKYIVEFKNPHIFINLFVSPNSIIETASGEVYRDYIEVMSPDMRIPYSDALESVKCATVIE
jgi:hypothetical protein